MCVVQLFFISVLLRPSSPSAEGDVRLVSSGPAQCYGRVEVFHGGEWGTVCDDGWGMVDAEVVCRQTDCGTAVDFTYGARFGEGAGRIWLKEVKCSGGESALTHCPHDGFGAQGCKHHEDAGVVCLKPPVISAEVTWGQQVIVTCSMSSAFTGGVMALKHVNTTVRTSTLNPATFTFPRGTYNGDGPFHCLYQEHVLEKTYSSPQSAPATAESRVPLMQVVVPSAAGGVLLLLALLSLLLCVVYRRRSTTKASAPPQMSVGAVDDCYKNDGQEKVDEEVCVSVGSAENHEEVYYATPEDHNELYYATADKQSDDYENDGQEEDYENVGQEEDYVNVSQQYVDN